jgi:hypothetical protein
MVRRGIVTVTLFFTTPATATCPSFSTGTSNTVYVGLAATTSTIEPQKPTATGVSARLELTLPNNCGTSALFEERVRTRSDRIHFSSQETALVVRAEISNLENGLLRAQMTLIHPDGNVATRTIEASNCEQAIDGLALVTAVTLDPSALTRPPEVESVPLPEPRAPRTPPNVTRALKESSQLPDATAPIERKPQEHLQSSLSFAAIATHGPAPDWMIGGEVAVQWTLHRASVFSPSTRIGVSYQSHNDVVATGGVADFSLTSTALDLCPIRFERSPIQLRTCAFVTAGRLNSVGRRTIEPETHHRPWGALGTSAEAAISFNRYVSLPLRGFVGFPLTRDSYQFAPSSFYHTPKTLFGISAGLAIHFR